MKKTTKHCLNIIAPLVFFVVISVGCGGAGEDEDSGIFGIGNLSLNALSSSSTSITLSWNKPSGFDVSPYDCP